MERRKANDASFLQMRRFFMKGSILASRNRKNREYHFIFVFFLLLFKTNPSPFPLFSPCETYFSLCKISSAISHIEIQNTGFGNHRPSLLSSSVVACGVFSAITPIKVPGNDRAFTKASNKPNLIPFQNNLLLHFLLIITQ